jgi:hypothetical protein
MKHFNFLAGFLEILSLKGWIGISHRTVVRLRGETFLGTAYH